jgi:hypothetical protein
LWRKQHLLDLEKAAQRPQHKLETA